MLPPSALRVTHPGSFCAGVHRNNRVGIPRGGSRACRTGQMAKLWHTHCDHESYLMCISITPNKRLESSNKVLPRLASQGETRNVFTLLWKKNRWLPVKRYFLVQEAHSSFFHKPLSVLCGATTICRLPQRAKEKNAVKISRQYLSAPPRAQRARTLPGRAPSDRPLATP